MAKFYSHFTDEQKDLFAHICSDISGPTATARLIYAFDELMECFESLESIPVSDDVKSICEVVDAVSTYLDLQSIIK